MQTLLLSSQGNLVRAQWVMLCKTHEDQQLAQALCQAAAELGLEPRQCGVPDPVL